MSENKLVSPKSKEEAKPAHTLDPITKAAKEREATKLGHVTKFFKNPGDKFLKACASAESFLKLKPGKLNTKRQASKWLMGKGAAWRFGR